MALLPLVCAADGTYGVESSSYSGAAWPVANRILYMPLRMPEAFTVKRVYWTNASSASGNTNVGLYTPAGTRLWELGSTAQGGTNQTIFTDIADQSHAAGLYYFAMQHSNNSGQFGRAAPSAWALARLGMLQEDPGSFALPATATFVSIASNYCPLAGLDLRG